MIKMIVLDLSKNKSQFNQNKRQNQNLNKLQFKKFLKKNKQKNYYLEVQMTKMIHF